MEQRINKFKQKHDQKRPSYKFNRENLSMIYENI